MTTTRLAPDTIAAQTNLTGAVTDIDDDPLSPDGLWLAGGDDGTDTTLRVTFPSPATDLNTGAGLQTFQVWCRAFVDDTGNPTVDIELWENGSQVSILSTGTTITSSTGQLVSATWDATLLSAVSGANVELYVIGHRSGGSPGARRSVEFGAVDWIADHAADNRTGTLAATDAVDTAAFAGGIVGDGTLAATDVVDTAAFAGGIVADGTLAATDVVDTAAFAGDLSYSGTLAATDIADTAAFAGDLSYSGTLAATDVIDTAAFAGSLAGAGVTGTLAATDVVDTAAFAGGITGTGTLAATDPVDTSAFAGSLSYSGTLAATDPADTAAFAGSLSYSGTLAATDPVDTASFAGNLAGAGITGTLAATDVVDVSSMSGGVEVSGTLAATDPIDVSSMSGGVEVSGTLAATDPVDAAAFAGNLAVTVTGTLAATDTVDAAAFAGTATEPCTGLIEVDAGSYNLGSKSGWRHPAYDFANRKWYAITNNTGGGGEDMLETYSMADHSLISSVAINWDLSVDNKGWDCFVDPFTGYIWTKYEQGFDTGIAVIDPADASLLAINEAAGGLSGDGAWSTNEWARIEVGGESVFVSEGALNTTLELTKYDTGNLTWYATVSGFSSISVIIGHKVIDGTSTALYWWDGTNVKESIVTLAGAGATTIFWTPGFGRDFMIDPDDNNMVILDGTDVYKYETADATFVKIWENLGVLSSASNIFGRRGLTNPIERVGVFIWLASTTVDIITLYDGSLAGTIPKPEVVDFTGPQIVWDDESASAWHSNRGGTMWRWTAGCQLSLNLSPYIDGDTGEGLGGHPPPLPINFERPRPNSSCDC